MRRALQVLNKSPDAGKVVETRDSCTASTIVSSVASLMSFENVSKQFFAVILQEPKPRAGPGSESSAHGRSLFVNRNDPFCLNEWVDSIHKS